MIGAVSTFIVIDKHLEVADTARMISLLVHAIVGLTIIAWIVVSNRQVFARPADGPAFTALECIYYVVGVASIALGWYFNVRFVVENATAGGNLFHGAGSYPHFLRLQFANPAAGSAAEDYLIANVILLPLFSIVDGYRRGLRRPWLYFLCSFFTSFSFPLAFYFATIERQRRHTRFGRAPATVDV